MAVKGNNVDIVLVLLKPDSSIVYIEENKGNTPLHIATRKGRPDVSENDLRRLFIDCVEVVEVDDEGRFSTSGKETIMGMFSRTGDKLVGKEIRGGDNAWRRQKKLKDVLHKFEDDLRRLFSDCVEVVEVNGNNVDIVLVLLKPDSSIVYIEENKGNTPLHIATRKGRPDVSENDLRRLFIDCVEVVEVDGWGCMP
ncbi:hypothetical protein HPP92_025654 [Vanilla planifolia]|uniref:Uncharacterized protein n=1 Tax=Vanilla planifolia TaxID=51239 RepID=A0A835PFS8_VANPL|nr:hypothetical protein HPP92_025654 [Vanilla planifolia]